MAGSWHFRRFARYCIVCLRGSETTPMRIGVDAYDVHDAYRRVRELGCTPVAVWSVN